MSSVAHWSIWSFLVASSLDNLEACVRTGPPLSNVCTSPISGRQTEAEPAEAFTTSATLSSLCFSTVVMREFSDMLQAASEFVRRAPALCTGGGAAQELLRGVHLGVPPLLVLQLLLDHIVLRPLHGHLQQWATIIAAAKGGWSLRSRRCRRELTRGDATRQALRRRRAVVALLAVAPHLVLQVLVVLGVVLQRLRELLLLLRRRKAFGASAEGRLRGRRRRVAPAWTG